MTNLTTESLSNSLRQISSNNSSTTRSTIFKKKTKTFSMTTKFWILQEWKWRQNKNYWKHNKGYSHQCIFNASFCSTTTAASNHITIVIGTQRKQWQTKWFFLKQISRFFIACSFGNVFVDTFWFRCWSRGCTWRRTFITTRSIPNFLIFIVFRHWRFFSKECHLIIDHTKQKTKQYTTTVLTTQQEYFYFLKVLSNASCHHQLEQWKILKWKQPMRKKQSNKWPNKHQCICRYNKKYVLHIVLHLNLMIVV